MIDERIEKLSQESIVVTDPADLQINELSKEEFDKKWLYRPIKISGIFDHDKE